MPASLPLRKTLCYRTDGNLIKNLEMERLMGLTWTVKLAPWKFGHILQKTSKLDIYKWLVEVV